MSASSDNDLLQILNAHGQQFLTSFSLPNPSSGKKRKSADSSSRPSKVPKLQPPEPEDDEEEWTGIQLEQSESEEDVEKDFEQEDDEFTSATPNETVVVFSETARQSRPSSLSSMSQKKAFMSSKVSKLREDPGLPQPESSPADEEDERTNAQNDALLHRLVHTKLLSGSLNPELNMTSAHKKKALAGRVLELSGQAKLGKGEKSVREGERNKAAKRVREGMLEKQKERHKQQVEEAKNLGNYHPTIKKLFESTDTSNAPKKNRDRGLKMGVGKFSGGMLKLSRDEISRVQDGPRRGGGRGRGRGGRGGSSRGRR
ncbi:hypothetical protein C8F04DRAFT_1172054 [Mycena alexandri]|uniref:Uncharacterized protein n=1 Tax=Mycena alexandri TaxID=1745969 RepID=A0AAD6XJK2_9AGAR|nr:hypothetical protein C8F04DRAFT_1172054 [Mycena alexandri]